MHEAGDALLNVLHPVQDAVPCEDERIGRRLDRHGVACPVGENLQPLPRSEVRPSVGIEAPQASAEEFVLGPELFDPLAQRVHLGCEGPPPGHGLAPLVVRKADPAGDQEKLANRHAGSVHGRSPGGARDDGVTPNSVQGPEGPDDGARRHARAYPRTWNTPQTP
jgi:hypothetical protein